jgi:hypothetical protein
MNVKLPVDDEITARADGELIAELDSLWSTSAGDSGGKRWTREELHERTGAVDTNVFLSADDPASQCARAGST